MSKPSYEELLERIEKLENNDKNNICIESEGNNENGKYIKYSDGRMICLSKITSSTATTTSLPIGGYRSGAIYIDFPASFKSTPDTVVATSTSDINDNGFVINESNITKTGFTGFFWTVSSKTSASHSLRYIAVGNWK